MSPNEKIKNESYQNFGGVNEKASKYLTVDNDVLSLLNLDFQKPGSFSSVPGSAFYLGTTYVGKITGLDEYIRLSGASHVIFTSDTIAYQTDGVSTTPFRLGLTPNAIWDFVTFVDILFMANGSDFIKYNDTAAFKFSSPDGSTLNAGLGVAAAGLSGTFNYAYGYLTTSGYYSGVGSVATLAVAGTQAILSGFTYPGDYGITAAVIYRGSPGGSDLFRLGFLSLNGATFVDSGTTALSNFPSPDSSFFTLAPRYLELFQNSLFLIGSSQFPSTAFFSELGQPENIQPESNFEVRTNDGDYLTGGKFYGSGLYLFKQNTFSKVVGNDTTNFVLLDVSNEYGCISNRAIIVYHDIMLFLDKKGICRYNGATPEIISNKIEDTFLSMNIDAAIGNACAIHDKFRNQVKWAIPTNGSTFNNTMIVYDYITDGWTVKEGYFPSAMAYLKSYFPRQTEFYGGYSGSVHYVSASLFSNNGHGITYAMKSKFHSIFGPSITGQYRRLFIDTDPIVGITVPLTINFRINEQDDVVLTRETFFDQFQTRIEFGIPAKSLSIELITSGSSFPVRINGYTLEARLQRRV